MTTHTVPASSAPAPSLNGTADPGPLRAAHTANFPALLRQLGASLLVTTYQAGKLVESSFVVPTECIGEVAESVRASGPA